MNNVRLLLRGAARIGALKAALSDFFHSQPRLANACTGFATFSVGDVIAQRLEQERTAPSTTDGVDTINVARSLQVGMLGVVMNGFFLYNWFYLLDKVVGASMTSTSSVLLKMLADQVFYAPFAIISFFSFAALRTSSNLNDIYEAFTRRMENSFFSTYLADCRLWPLANYINFRWVPRIYRPSFSAVVQLLWQTYMSFITDVNNSPREFPKHHEDRYVNAVALCGEQEQLQQQRQQQQKEQKLASATASSSGEHDGSADRGTETPSL